MLKFLRKNKRATWIRGTFAAIVLVFIFWGIGAGVGMMGDRSEAAVRINGEVIEPIRFARAYANVERMYRQIYQDKIPPELLKSLDLKQRALDQLIRVSLLRQEAERIGLQVGDAELAESIQTMPEFQDGGIFTKQRYLTLLRLNNIGVGEFEESKREELLVRKMDDLIGAGAQVSDAEARQQYHLDGDKVNLDFVRIKASQFADQVQPTEADLQAYYDAHKEDFRIPERVRIEYLQYQPALFQAQVEVAAAEVQDYYDSHREQYEKPEEVRARHILIKFAPDAKEDEKAKARQRVEELLAKVKAGEDFAALATQSSQDEGSAAKGGDLGFFKRGQMVAPFEQAAFALEPGGVSDVVESPFGFHIIKVEEKHAAATQALEQVREQIVTTLKQERAGVMAAERARTDRDKALEGKDALAAIGQAAGITLATPAPFARTEVIAGLGREPKIIDAAFAGAAGDVPEVVETASSFYLIRIAEKLPSRIPEAAEARADVETGFRKQKTEELAKAKAEALLEQVKQQNALSAVAADNGLAVEETGSFTRSGTYVPKLGTQPELKQAAFQLNKDQAIAPAVYQASGDAVVAALKESVPADESKFDEQKDTLRQQVLDRRRTGANEQFVNDLKSRALIEVNQDVIAGIADTGAVPRRQR